jgi:hypothetical protein
LAGPFASAKNRQPDLLSRSLILILALASAGIEFLVLYRELRKFTLLRILRDSVTGEQGIQGARHRSNTKNREEIVNG